MTNQEAVSKTIPRQCTVVVLGAGRSGTSAITRGLQTLGVELGNQLRTGGGKNPTGFFEDEDLLALNKCLKNLLGIRGDSVALIDSSHWQTPAVQALQQEAIRTIRQRFGGYPLWGYKYTRTLRLLPFWREVFAALALDVRYLMVIRNPLSVARSRAKLDPRRGTQEKSDLEWLVNIVPYFRDIREQPFVVVDYDNVMANPAQQLARVAAALDLPQTASSQVALQTYAEEFLTPSLRHTHFTLKDLENDACVNRLTKDAYRWLYQLATNTVEPHSPALWQDWARIEAALAALAPVLRHLDRIEADLRHARRNLLDPFQTAPRVWRKLRQRWTTP